MICAIWIRCSLSSSSSASAQAPDPPSNAPVAEEGIGLNRTGVAEVLAEEGFPRLWPRPHAQRGLPRREPTTRTGVLDARALPEHSETKKVSR